TERRAAQLLRGASPRVGGHRRGCERYRRGQRGACDQLRHAQGGRGLCPSRGPHRASFGAWRGVYLCRTGGARRSAQDREDAVDSDEALPGPVGRRRKGGVRVRMDRGLQRCRSRSATDAEVRGTMMHTEACMEAAQNTMVVDLGSLRKAVEERVKTGSYASADEVIRAGLLALEREETATNEWLNGLAEESLADPSPSVPAAQVFRELRAKYG